MQSLCFTVIMNNFIFITVITKLIWHISLILGTEPCTLSRSSFLFSHKNEVLGICFVKLDRCSIPRRNFDGRSNTEGSSRLFLTRTPASTMNCHENKQKRENPEKVGFKSVKLGQWIHLNFVVGLNWWPKFFLMFLVNF